MALLTTGRQIGQTIKSAARLRTIVGVFASHGFQNVVERVKLGQYLLKRFFPDERLENLSPAVRIRMSFEQLGPTFVKLGQLLATRPDLIPPDYVEEFKKLHDQVRPVSFSEITSTLDHQFGDLTKIFLKFDEVPLASASIAQVHGAILIDGTEVVVKVRRPGIVETINDDLAVLYTLAGLLEKYIPETRIFSPMIIVDEFFKTLELETDFIVEANNIRRFTANFQGQDKIKIPKVYEELSGDQVLVMETLKGVPLNKIDTIPSEHIDKEEIIRTGLHAFFKMVFKDRFFHGDLHAGNLFILPNNQIGLIDFGVVGRLNHQICTSIADMLVALAREDYESFAYTYVEIAPYNEQIDVDQFARELRDLIAPYFGLSFKNVNLGRLLMDSTRLAARHGLKVPSELMLFFKSVVTVEGMGRLVIDDFDMLKFALEFAGEIVNIKYDPERISRDFMMLAKDSTALLYSLPRQLKLFLRKINNSDHAWRLRVDHIDDLRRSVETSSNLVFLGLITGSLILGAALTLHSPIGPTVFDMPLAALICVVLAGFTGFVAFINYIRK